MVYNLGKLLFPATCILCNRPGQGDIDLCIGCLGELRENRHSCSRCALPLPPSSPVNSLCGRCQKNLPPFDRLLAPWLYQDPLAELIRQLKFGKKLASGRSLGLLLARSLPNGTGPPRLLLPVPQHPRQLRRRGFNHAAEITRQLSRTLDIPWSPWLLTKTRDTRPQHGLNRRERQHNLRGCFALGADSLPDRVAVVDDVVTTGSTAAEIASTLKAAGVERVDVWALARTPLETAATP